MRQTFTGRGVVRKGVLTRAALGLAACAPTAAVNPDLEDARRGLAQCGLR